MKKRQKKLYISIVFISLFVAKMMISVAPVFLMLNSKTVNAVITQLEQESKDDKDSTEKDNFKDKKVFDEDKSMLAHCYTLTPILIETNILHNREHALFVQTYHPVVPTPPPNV